MRSFLFSVEKRPAVKWPVIAAESSRITTLARGQTAVMSMILRGKTMDEAQQIADYLNENIECIIVGLADVPSDEWVN